MTPSLTTWLSTARAEDTAAIIADKPVTLTIQRGGTTFSQTVRLEPMSGGQDAAANNATVSVQRVVIVGYKDHPTIADTTIRRGDRFYYGGQMFDVQHIYPEVPGRFLALAEATQ